MTEVCERFLKPPKLLSLKGKSEEDAVGYSGHLALLLADHQLQFLRKID